MKLRTIEKGSFLSLLYLGGDYRQNSTSSICCFETQLVLVALLRLDYQ